MDRDENIEIPDRRTVCLEGHGRAITGWIVANRLVGFIGLKASSQHFGGSRGVEESHLAMICVGLVSLVSVAVIGYLVEEATA